MTNIEFFNPKVGDQLYYIKYPIDQFHISGNINIIAIDEDKIITDGFSFNVPNLTNNGMPIVIRVGVQDVSIPEFDFDGDTVTLFKVSGGINV